MNKHKEYIFSNSIQKIHQQCLDERHLSYKVKTSKKREKIVLNHWSFNEFFLLQKNGFFIISFSDRAAICQNLCRIWVPYLIQHSCSFVMRFLRSTFYDQTHFGLSIFILKCINTMCKYISKLVFWHIPKYKIYLVSSYIWKICIKYTLISTT